MFCFLSIIGIVKSKYDKVLVGGGCILSIMPAGHPQVQAPHPGNDKNIADWSLIGG